MKKLYPEFKEAIDYFKDEKLSIVGVGEIEGEDVYVFDTISDSEKAHRIFGVDYSGLYYGRSEYASIIKNTHPEQHYIYWITHSKYGKTKEQVKGRLSKEAVFEIWAKPCGISNKELAYKHNRSLSVIRDIRSLHSYETYFQEFKSLPQSFFDMKDWVDLDLPDKFSYFVPRQKRVIAKVEKETNETYRKAILESLELGDITPLKKLKLN